jgi:chromosome segregation ATPase
LASYGGTLSAIIKLENERAAAQDRVGTAKARVEAAQTNDQAAREEVARIQAQIEKYGELAEAIKEQEAAERAYAEAQRDLEKARRSGAGEKAIKNREEKLSKASREMEGARLVVSLTKEGMEPEQIREYEKAIEDLSAATKNQKVASAELEDALKAQTTARGALATV